MLKFFTNSYVWFVLFRISLDISYYFIISPVFSYEGFYVSLSLESYFYSWLFYLLSFFFIDSLINDVGDYFFVTFLVSFFAPLTSMYGFSDSLSIKPIVCSFILLAIVKFFLVVKYPQTLIISTVKNGKRIALTLCFVFVSFLVFWFFLTGVTLNFNLMKVYDYRELNAEVSGGGVLSYTNAWTMQVFNIFLIAYCLLKRKFFYLSMFIGIQVFFFAASAHKSILFLPLLIIGVWFYFKKTNRAFIVPFSLTFIVTIVVLYTFFTDDFILSSLFIRRVFFTPANLTFSYFSFFENNDFIYWSNSFLSPLLSYPYHLPLSKLIGESLGNPDMGANNGFLSTGYAHFGYLGIVLYSILIALILRLINKLTREHYPSWLAIALCVVPIRNIIISADLLTVLLTHGLAMTIILLYLCRSKN